MKKHDSNVYEEVKNKFDVINGMFSQMKNFIVFVVFRFERSRMRQIDKIESFSFILITMPYTSGIP